MCPNSEKKSKTEKNITKKKKKKLQTTLDT